MHHIEAKCTVMREQVASMRRKRDIPKVGDVQLTPEIYKELMEKRWNKSISGNLNETSMPNVTYVSYNMTWYNYTKYNTSLQNWTKYDNDLDYPYPSQEKDPILPNPGGPIKHKTCDNGDKYTCLLMRVKYIRQNTTYEANLYISYKDYMETGSECSIDGCEHDVNHYVAVIGNLSKNFDCFHDTNDNRRIFLNKKPFIGTVIWFSACLVLLVFGTMPFVVCICSQIKTPWQVYFRYCTRRFASRQERWIEAIKSGNILVLKWSMSQDHVNDQLIEHYYGQSVKWVATPLARAAFAGQSRVAIYLLGMGADVNLQDRLGLTPVHYACLGGQHVTLQLLIQRHAWIDTFDKSHRTPLLTSLLLPIKLPDIIQCLIEGGADLSLSDRYKCTALHYVCFKGDVNLVAVMIKAGCISHMPVFLTKNTFHSDLDNAPFGVRVGFTSNLYTSTWTPLTSLLYKNNREACKLLIAAGYNLRKDPILPRVLYSDADEAMYRYIKRNLREVMSLLRLCRIWIRKYLGTVRLQSKIAQLDLTVGMIDYLRLDKL